MFYNFQETYGSFHYTSLLYLTTYKKDFTGGRFIFIDKAQNSTVEPKLGKIIISDSRYVVGDSRMINLLIHTECIPV